MIAESTRRTLFMGELVLDLLFRQSRAGKSAENQGLIVTHGAAGIYGYLDDRWARAFQVKVT